MRVGCCSGVVAPASSEDHGDTEGPWQLSEVAQDGHDFLREVLVDAMERNERTEEPQTGPKLVDGFTQARLITRRIDPPGGSRNDLEIKLLERDFRGVCR